MLFGTRNVTTRSLLNLTAVFVFLLCGMGAAWAANTGAAPQLVPYETNLLAGTQVNIGGSLPAYGGDGGPGTAAAIGSPVVLAVDSVGNVYFGDNPYGMIREINAQTGVINNVAGVPPSNCSGTTCSHITTGCADGVPAYHSGIGSSIQGMVIDAYGNLYWTDSNQQIISVIYRGGTQVANFIKLVNPGAVTKSNGVQQGYIYHIAGTINESSCAATATTAATATAAAIPAGDGQLAYNGGGSTVGPTFSLIQGLGLDSAGNIYVEDASNNSTIRVINTQAVAQTFFPGPSGSSNAGITVQPGYIKSIMNCSSLTVTCPAESTPLTLQNTGVGGPPDAGVFNTFSTGMGQSTTVDAYGNVFELNYKGADPAIVLAVGYAGGTAMGRLINQALLAQAADSPTAGGISGVSGMTATQGSFYYLLQNITLRPSSIAEDSAGNLYYTDNHYGNVFRIDVNAVEYGPDYLPYTFLFDGGASTDNRNSPATAAAPAFCYGTSGSGYAPSTTNAVVAGYQTTDAFGDGCPAIYANGLGAPHSGNGYGSAIADGPGDVFIADKTNNLIRSVTLNNIFAPAAVGRQLNTTTLVGQQSLEVHFDQTNLPVLATASGLTTTSSFSIAPGISDFTINPISTQFTDATASGIELGGTQAPITTAIGAATNPFCANVVSANADSSQDCVVNVIFSPTLPGLRQNQLVVTTANGSVYNFGLTGIGQGPQLAIDGGTPTTVALTGLGNVGQVAVTSSGTIYAADPSNNRIVVSSSTGTTAQTSIGPSITLAPLQSWVAASVSSSITSTTLSHPMGVAVDAANNIYISDTGNNRILKVNPITGIATVLGLVQANITPTPASYAFNAPEGLVVDVYGNVYVADTGNGKVVEIPSNIGLGGAVPLLQYPNAPTFSAPTAVALDNQNNLYVADPGNIQVIKIPAGGGDLQTLTGATLSGFGAQLSTPSGVAVDAAGDVYVSDSTTNQVIELPAGAGLGSVELPLSFTGLNLTGSAPSVKSFAGGSLALDANGNIYVADSGNSRVLFVNRQNPTVNCGTIPLDNPQTTCGGAPLSGQGANTLTITNIGNKPATISSPFTQVTSTANAAFSFTNNCAGIGTLAPGAYCTISPTFTAQAKGAQSDTISVNGSSQSVTFNAVVIAPQVNITLAVTSPSGGAVANSPATITATVTQPHVSGVTVTGPVTFTVTNSCAADSAIASQTVQLAGSGGTSTAQFTLPTLLQGRQYTINATYNDDASDSTTSATPLVVYIPGISGVTATAASVTSRYGQAPPAITGTVTGILAADASSLKYTFSSQASATTPVGTYPITVTFSGAADACNYGIVPVLTSSGTPAVVTENPAPLTVKTNSATAQYGAPNLDFTSTITGLVNGDKLAETYSPAQSQILNVGTYPIVPTIIGKAAGNYTVTVTNGTLTVTAAPSQVTISDAATSVLPTGLASNPLTLTVGTAVLGGIGTPTGTVTITDVFTPIISSAPGGGAQTVASGQASGIASTTTTIGPLTLSFGTATYTPTSQTLGTHVYTVSYSGDSNFSPSTSAPSTLIVDNADYTLTSTANAITIAPGVIPGGNSAISGEATATPETAVITVNSLLSYTGSVYFTCIPQNPSYTSCAMVAPAVTVPKGSTITATLSVQTPATLPLGFNFNQAAVERGASKAVLAILPFGVLAFLVRGRRRLSKSLWMVAIISVIGAGFNGCSSNNTIYGHNAVDVYTPIPAGWQSITVYACTVQSSCPSVSILGTLTSGSASVASVSNTSGLTVGGEVVSPGVGFTGTTTNGSTTVTGIPSTIGITTGVAVTGAGIPSGATITAVTPSTSTASGSITISSAATASAASIQVQAASPIAPGTTIASVGSGTITLSTPAIGSGTAGLTTSTTSTGLTRSLSFATYIQ